MNNSHNSTVMPFGKYKGLLIKDIPIDYLEWALENIDSTKLKDIVYLCYLEKLKVEKRENDKISKQNKEILIEIISIENNNSIYAGKIKNCFSILEEKYPNCYMKHPGYIFQDTNIVARVIIKSECKKISSRPPVDDQPRF